MRYKSILPNGPKPQDHPCHKSNIKKKRKADDNYVNYCRQGKTLEKQILGQLSYLRLSYASGSIGNDGDAQLNVEELEGLVNNRIEHKTRFNNKNTYGPTKGELDKGRKQKVGCYFITTKRKPNTLRPITSTRIFVEQNVFTDILFSLDIRAFENKDFSTDKRLVIDHIKKYEHDIRSVSLSTNEININTLAALKQHEQTLNTTDLVFVKYNNNMFLSCKLKTFSLLMDKMLSRIEI